MEPGSEPCKGEALPPSEELLKRINELEVSHAHLKEEMIKLLDTQQPELEVEADSVPSSSQPQSFQPQPCDRSPVDLRRGSPERARFESGKRGHKLVSSPQRSHSVSPQRTRMATSRRASFEARRRAGPTLPLRTGSSSRHASPLQQEWSSAGSTQSALGKESSSEGAFPNQFTDRHYINILQSMGQSVHIFKPSGEITYWYIWVVYQMGGVIGEALRLIFMEILVKRKGLKLNPITLMYYVSPCSALCLFIPWIFLEKPKMDSAMNWTFDPVIMSLNALCTLQRWVSTSWIVVLLSALLFADTKLTTINLLGYGVAIAGVAAYNNYKIKPEASSAKTTEVVMEDLSANVQEGLDTLPDNVPVNSRYSDRNLVDDARMVDEQERI